MKLELHRNIKDTLNNFTKSKLIPNIIFHGPHGSGKRTLVTEFINNIYDNNKDIIQQYTMNVNCAHGKGIKFVREDLKFFAKSHINVKSSKRFKIIIMANADKLTMDAQSALRRCIELYNHTTRFFIIVENKFNLLKPILSRFCEFYIPRPIINNVETNLHKYIIDYNFDMPEYNKNKEKKLDSILKKKVLSNNYLTERVRKLYESGYSAIDIMNYIENSNMDEKNKWRVLLVFHKVKKEYRNERLLMYFLLYFYYFRSNDTLENVLNM